jgi:hypothetical protein
MRYRLREGVVELERAIAGGTMRCFEQWSSGGGALKIFSFVSGAARKGGSSEHSGAVVTGVCNGNVPDSGSKWA